jgi:protein-tyrosine phosphatase
MAHVFLASQIRNIPEFAHYTVTSAGLWVREGQESSSDVRTIAKARGFSLEDHRAQSLTQTMVDQAVAILCVTLAHEKFLKENFVNLPKTCTSFLEFGNDIADPYAGNAETYERIAAEIEQKIPSIIEFLRKELNDH